MTDAMIDSGVLDETTDDEEAYDVGPMGRELLVARCPDEGLKAKYLYSRAKRDPPGEYIDNKPVEFIDHLRLIATEFVSRSEGRYGYDTALKTLCDVVVQTFNLSIGLTDYPMFHVDSERYSPAQACLSVACALGDLGLVSALLKMGDVEINPTEPLYFLSYPIRAAVRGGHRDVVDYLLQRRSRIEPVDFERQYAHKLYWTVLEDSILNHESDMLAFILDQRLEYPVRERYAGGRLGSAHEGALITAARQDNYVAFNMLLEIGPIKAPFPVSLLQIVLVAACEGRSISIARSIFDIDSSLNPNYDVTQFAQVPYFSRMGRTSGERHCPLEAAAHWGSMPLVELLLSHGADPNWNKDRSWCAVWRAAANGYDRCADLLLRAGADPDGWPSLKRLRQGRS